MVALAMAAAAAADPRNTDERRVERMARLQSYRHRELLVQRLTLLLVSLSLVAVLERLALRGNAASGLPRQRQAQLQLGPRLTRLPSYLCLLYTSPSPRDATLSRMPSSA